MTCTQDSRNNEIVLKHETDLLAAYRMAKTKNNMAQNAGLETHHET